MSTQIMFSPKEAAVYLRLSKPTILRYIKQGDIKVSYINKRVIRISNLEIERLLEQS